MILLEDNLRKLKWGGSLWHIIKKDSPFQISREEQKQAKPIKHFIMISPKSKPDSDFFPSEQISSKKKNPLWNVDYAIWRNLLSSWKVPLIWVFLLLALLLKIETKYYLFIAEAAFS